MEDNINMTNQPNRGDKPKPDVRPFDGNRNPERKDVEPSDQSRNPNPDSRPNEIRATDPDYRYRGGRQGVGEVPDPQEVREDVANNRGTGD